MGQTQGSDMSYCAARLRADANVSSTSGGPWEFTSAVGVADTMLNLFTCQNVSLQSAPQHADLTTGLANFWKFLFVNGQGMALVVAVVGPSLSRAVLVPTTNLLSCQMITTSTINGSIIDSTEAASRASLSSLPQPQNLVYVQYSLTYTPAYIPEPIWELTWDACLNGSYRGSQLVDAINGDLLQGTGGSC